MNFAFDEQQRELGATVASALSDIAGLTAPALEPQGHAEAWDSLAGLGLFALLVPDAHDGVGLSMIDLALSFEAIGASLAPPLVASTLIATDLISQFGSDAQKSSRLPAIAAGECRIAIATIDASGSAIHSGRLRGEKLLVPGAANADLFLITARDGANDRLLLVDGKTNDIAIEPHESLDPTSSLDRLTFDQVDLGSDAALGGVDASGRLLDLGATVHAGMMSGIADRMLMTAVEYAKTREQFGKPIGSFQAIKHRCADMAVAVEAGRSAAYYAFWAVSEGDPDAARAASMAKAYCGEVARFVCNEAIQVHGGMGFTWELGLHRYLRRAKLFQHSFGDTAFHQERVLAETLASAPSPLLARRDAA